MRKGNIRRRTPILCHRSTRWHMRKAPTVMRTSSAVLNRAAGVGMEPGRRLNQVRTAASATPGKKKTIPISPNPLSGVSASGLKE